MSITSKACDLKSQDASAIRSLIMCYLGFRRLSYQEFLTDDGVCYDQGALCAMYSTKLTAAEQSALKKEAENAERAEALKSKIALGAVLVGIGVIGISLTGLSGVVRGTLPYLSWLAKSLGRAFLTTRLGLGFTSAAIILSPKARSMIGFLIREGFMSTNLKDIVQEAIKEENRLLQECQVKKPFALLCKRLHVFNNQSKTMDDFRRHVIRLANTGRLLKTKHLLAWHFFDAAGRERTPRQICLALCNL